MKKISCLLIATIILLNISLPTYAYTTKFDVTIKSITCWKTNDEDGTDEIYVKVRKGDGPLIQIFSAEMQVLDTIPINRTITVTDSLIQILLFEADWTPDGDDYFGSFTFDESMSHDTLVFTNNGGSYSIDISIKKH